MAVNTAKRIVMDGQMMPTQNGYCLLYGRLIPPYFCAACSAISQHAAF
jgi:hypothetical protein